MKEHTKIQIIKEGNRPVFAIVPYKEWLNITKQHISEAYIPHDVVGLQLEHGISLIAAWRKYRKMTQTALGKKIGISQPAMAQIEKKDAHPKDTTLKKIALALDVNIDQLTD